MTEKPPALSIGTRLGDGGRYEIRQRIGIGGMAEVYRADDTRLGNRSVAIKTLSASVAEHPFADRMRSLFIQEAQALSLVKDENVVDVLDFGAAADGTPYMVMEFLNGTDLGVFLKKNKQVTIEQAVDVMLGVCAGVHACHLAGIIHRDLKPANIFLTRTLKGEQTKVLDFSVAKVPIAPSTASTEQTKTDLIVGTPTYMSPEQAIGRPANELSDQYSIGALLYRCLTGRPPQGLLPRPREMRPEIPEPLEAAMLRALDPTPDKRFATVHDLGHGLLPFASSAARGRWRSYYSTAPRPVDPTTTGSFSSNAPRPTPPTVAPEPASVPSSPATLAAQYDFKAHERITKLDPDRHRGEAPESATSTKSTTVDDVEPLSAPSTRPSAQFTSVDVPITDSSASPASDRVPLQPQASGAAASVSQVRGRRRLLAAFGAIAVLVLAVTIAGIRSTMHRDASPVTPAAPKWTQPSDTVVSMPQPPVREVTGPTDPGGPRLLPAPEQGEHPSRINRKQPAAPAARPKRRRHSSSEAKTIQYGADGLPILH